MENLGLLILALFIDLAITSVIVMGVYFPSQKDKAYVLTFFSLNLSVFLIATLFSQLELSVGVSFGLFAIFSILRYRTDPIPVREMTYLFILMALPVIDVVMISENMIAEAIISNLVVLIVFYVIERALGFRYEARKSVTYEKIELIKPENYDALLSDLRERTGLDITRCEIGKIDFLHDVAELKIYYTNDDALVGTQRKKRTIR